mmetsp:Transcript_3120/g.6293  ORF Transcript_3120/g.6293 Transcript_3120/m.6293 type:complete len:94 (-) Transcript_3120:613-894(-)
MQVPAQPLRPISEELPRPDLTEAEEGEGLPYAAADVENVSPPPQPRRIMAVQQPAAPPAARDKSEVYGLGELCGLGDAWFHHWLLFGGSRLFR